MLYKLILAHLVADFVLQPKWLVLRKRQWDGLAIHVSIVLLTMIIVAWNELAQWGYWIVGIAAVHAIADWSKIRLEPCLKLPPILPFLGDQAVHIAAIIVVILIASPAEFHPNNLELHTLPATSEEAGFTATMQPSLAEPHSLEAHSIWLIAIAYIISTFAASIALPIWLDPPCLMKRTPLPRMATITASAIVLTLAWQGWGLIVPVLVLGLYQLGARKLAQLPSLSTFGVELLSASVLAASMGWLLH